MLYWSEACCYGQIYPLPTEEELSRFYCSTDYASYLAGVKRGAPQVRRSLLRRVVDSLVFRVARRIETAPDTNAEVVHEFLGRPSHICDVGCGSGVMLAGLESFGHRVTGVEPNRAAREEGVQRGIDIVDGSGDDLSPVDERRFDLVTMVQSLEHTHDPLKAIRNCAALLKPGGHLWIEVPNHESSGFAMRGPVWFHTDAGRHMHFFSRASLEQAMVAAGLECVAVRFSGYVRQFTWQDAETAVWDSLYADSSKVGRDVAPPRPDDWSRLRLLMATKGAPPHLRCDSVGVIARKAQA